MNNVGNYPGKRTPKPAPKPKTAQERFGILCSMYHQAYKTLEEKRAETREHLKLIDAGKILSSRAKARAARLAA